jgi:acyl-CoA thioesterase FadM
VAYIETYRSVVAPAHCDHLGHMNVSRYFAAVGDGMFALQTMLGLGPADIRDGRGLSFAVVRSESDFRAELVAGDVIRLESAIEEAGEKLAVFRHRLVRAEDDRLAFETRFRCVMLDLASRRAVPIPDAVRARCEPFMLDAGAG